MSFGQLMDSIIPLAGAALSILLAKAIAGKKLGEDADYDNMDKWVPVLRVGGGALFCWSVLSLLLNFTH